MTKPKLKTAPSAGHTPMGLGDLRPPNLQTALNKARAIAGAPLAQAEIPCELERQAIAVSELGETLDVLFHKLDGVLDPIATAVEHPPSHDCKTSVGKSIAAATEQVRVATNRIRNLVELLAL